MRVGERAILYIAITPGKGAFWGLPFTFAAKCRFIMMRTITNGWPALLLALGVAALFSCQRRMAAEAPRGAQNIILLIGDGMGLAQLSTSFYFGDTPSNFPRFSHIGLHQNYAVGAKITDSAAGATAFATGYKTYNEAIGVDGDTLARQTILEWAAGRGKATGVIATSSITDATPASFYAHVPFRRLNDAIAAQLADAPVDFFAGGGRQHFARRADGLNYLDTLRARGFAVDTSALRPLPGRRKAYLLAADGMPRMMEGRGAFLADATRMALEQLAANPNGFFLMVEGSQIDWAGHNNEGQYLTTEMKDFDQVVGLALDFAARDGNTLVVVTADHETGGLSLSGSEAFGRRSYEEIMLTFSTGGHSASLIPVFAYGPGAERFMGIYQNADIHARLMAAWKKEKIKDPPAIK
jgi:alkaline phosphatase